MMKNIQQRVFIGYLSFVLALTAGFSFALEGRLVIGKDSIIGLYFNFARVYARGMDVLKNIDKPENQPYKVLLTQVWEKAAANFGKALEKAAQPEQGKPAGLPKFDEVVKRVLDFDQRDLFRPNGGIWFAVDSQGVPGFMLEARLKPGEFVKFLNSLDEKMQQPEKAGPELVTFRMAETSASGTAFMLDFLPGGLSLHREDAATSQPPVDWDVFLKLGTGSDTLMAFELDGARLNRIIEKESAGSGKWKPDPRLQSISRVRFHASKSGAKLAAAVSDAQMRENYKNILKMGLQQGQATLAQKASQSGNEAQVAEIKVLLEKMTVFDADGWVGLSLENVPTRTLLAGVIGITGIAAAIAIPNFQMAQNKARAKACHANLRLIAQAVELYNLDKGEPLKTLDIPLLVEKSYLKGPPMCPDAGVYSLEGYGASFQIRCSRHGSFVEE